MNSRQTFIIIRTVSNSLIIGSLLFIILAFGPIFNTEIGYRYRQWRGITYTLDKVSSTGQAVPKPSTFGLLLGQPTPLHVEPINRGFSIVIEKLGVNAPVVKNVNMASYKDYFEALKFGVAQAAGTAIPSEENGNSFLFAHSALDFWNFGKYAMVFTLLNKLETGDRIVVFYENKRFDYIVFKKEVVKEFDITPIKRDYGEPILTLQTCDPPGTALNRLIITARLVR